jgi:hypothetical protein
MRLFVLPFVVVAFPIDKPTNWADIKRLCLAEPYHEWCEDYSFSSSSSDESPSDDSVDYDDDYDGGVGSKTAKKETASEIVEGLSEDQVMDLVKYLQSFLPVYVPGKIDDIDLGPKEAESLSVNL